MGHTVQRILNLLQNVDGVLKMVGCIITLKLPLFVRYRGSVKFIKTILTVRLPLTLARICLSLKKTL